MSHEATIWAVKVRGISCTEARVLWHLADCHNPIFGCYPKQDYLADACEIDVRSIRRALDSLRAKGFVNWIEQREGKNRKANRYSLGFEEGFRAFAEGGNAENEPDNLSASTAPSTGQDCTLEPDRNDGLNRTPESSIEPVREPVKKPVREEEERASADEEDERRLQARVKALEIGRHNNPWPAAAARSTRGALREFMALSPENRRLAEERRDAYLAYCKSFNLAPLWLANYLKERKFLDIGAIAPSTVAPAKPGKVPAPPFGPLFGAVRAWLCLQGADDSRVPLDVRDPVIRHVQGLEQRGLHSLAMSYLSRRGITLGPSGEFVFPDGFDTEERLRRLSESGFPEVNALHEKAKIHQPAAVASRFLPLRDLCEPVPVDSTLFAEWLAHDERAGWPRLPDPGRMDVVWLPRGGPHGLEAFEASAKQTLEAPEERGDEHAA